MNALGDQLREGLQGVFDGAGVPARVQGMGSMLQVYFTDLPEVRTYRDFARIDEGVFSRWAREMILRGVFVHPDGQEHIFLSAAHTEEDVARIVAAAAEAIGAI
jgi:glutamate-1-semialdehyde 2,1-aminomutase